MSDFATRLCDYNEAHPQQALDDYLYGYTAVPPLPSLSMTTELVLAASEDGEQKLTFLTKAIEALYADSYYVTLTALQVRGVEFSLTIYDHRRGERTPGLKTYDGGHLAFDIFTSVAKLGMLKIDKFGRINVACRMCSSYKDWRKVRVDATCYAEMGCVLIDNPA